MTDTDTLISSAQARTLVGLFRERVARSPAEQAYRQYSPGERCWLGVSWSEMASRVARWRCALRAEGLSGGDRVAVMLRNSTEWVCFDQAALAEGLVTVPLYTNDRPENVAYIVCDAGIRLLVIEGMRQWHALREVLPRLSGVHRVVSVEGFGEGADSSSRCTALEAWLPARAAELPTAPLEPDALATIMYTSGTTGRPKGVMLSHRNILDNAHAAGRCLAPLAGQMFLSFLPLSHSLERTGGYYLPMMGGATVVFSRSINHLAEDLRVVRPTVLISVPRIFEMFHHKIVAGIGDRPLVSRWLFRLATRVGWRRFEYRQGRVGWSAQLLLWPLLDRLVGTRILTHLGGRIQYAICGGAALSPQISRLFLGLGLPLYQGYGMTEASPVISVNRPDDNVPESIGIPLPGIEVRIGGQDELLTRSTSVMPGYWNNPEATAQAIDEAGWLHTGDQARVDSGGHLYIIGRLKDIIVLGTGEKVPPADMELAILEDPLFEQVMLVGEGRPFLSLLAVLNTQQWEALARELGLDAHSPAALDDRGLHKVVLRRIAGRLGVFPGYAQVRKVTLDFTPWTVEEGLLTPTLKVRRPQVSERFRDRIEGMYVGYR